MQDDLYEQDFLVWSEKQAGLLRQLARGERVNEAVDWDHLIEEVEDLGQSELRRVRSFLRLALVHPAKLRLHPESDACAHWPGEAINFIAQARDGFAPSMADKVDLEALYALALRQACTGETTNEPSSPFPERCPFTLDESRDPFSDIDALVAKLG